MSLAIRNFNDLINSAITHTYFPNGYTDNSVNYAAYHQQSNENEHRIEVPLVGMTRENVNVDVQNSVLTITANSDTKSKFIRNFKQSWNLSTDCDVDSVVAKLENGLLTVTVPRVKPVKKVVNVSVV